MERIRTGEILPTAAAVELDQLEKQTLNEPLAKELAFEANRAALAAITATLSLRGDGLVTDLVDPAIRAAAATVSDVSPTIAGLRNSDAAMKGGPAMAKAWALCLQAIDQIKAAWDLADRLRFHGITHTLPNPKPHRECWEWRDVDAIPRRPVTDVHAFVDAIAAGAQPGALTAEEVVDTYFAEPPVQPAGRVHPPKDPSAASVTEALDDLPPAA